MSSRDALFLAVRDDFADDGPRLVLADWLEEHGDSGTHGTGADRDRATFIRVQTTLARLPSWDPHRLALEPLEADLLRRHGAAWRADLPAGLRGAAVGFTRGFLEQAEVPVAALNRSLESLVGTAYPVQRLVLRGAVGRIGPEVTWPAALAGIRDLDLRGAGSTVLDQLIDSPHLAAIERLWVSSWGDVAGETLRKLLASPALVALRDLRVEGRWLGGSAEPLTLEPVLDRLQSLDLVRSPDCDRAAAAVAGRGRCSRLAHLGLHSSQGTGEGVAALARAELPALESLALHEPSARTAAGRLAVMSRGAPWLGQLRSLALAGPTTTAEDLQALLAAPALAGLVRLSVNLASAGSAGLSALAAVTTLDALGDLELARVREAGVGCCPVSSARRLARCGLLTRLHRLALPDALGDEPARALLATPAGASLAHLDLRNNHYSPFTSAKLAGSGWLRGVVTLNLDGCQIGDGGAAALAACDHAGRLSVLHLRSNRLGPAGAAALAASPLLREVTDLDLSHNPLGPEGARALAESPHLARLSRLALDNADLGPEGVRTLAWATNMPALASLQVSRNEAGEGLWAFLDSPHRSKLTHLRWSGNGEPTGLTVQLNHRFGTGPCRPSKLGCFD